MFMLTSRDAPVLGLGLSEDTYVLMCYQALCFVDMITSFLMPSEVGGCKAVGVEGWLEGQHAGVVFTQRPLR